MTLMYEFEQIKNNLYVPPPTWVGLTKLLKAVAPIRCIWVTCVVILSWAHFSRWRGSAPDRYLGVV